MERRLVYAEIILASGDAEIRVLMKLFHGIQDGNGIPIDWVTSLAIPILQGKGDFMNRGMHRGVNLLEHAMTIVDKLLDKSCNDI